MVIQDFGSVFVIRLDVDDGPLDLKIYLKIMFKLKVNKLFFQRLNEYWLIN